MIMGTKIEITVINSFLSVKNCINLLFVSLVRTILFSFPCIDSLLFLLFCLISTARPAPGHHTDAFKMWKFPRYIT